MPVSSRNLAGPGVDCRQINSSPSKLPLIILLRLLSRVLFQVLISIQSMILNEEPYLNEPGWANMAGTSHSKSCEWYITPFVVL